MLAIADLGFHSVHRYFLEMNRQNLIKYETDRLKVYGPVETRHIYPPKYHVIQGWCLCPVSLPSRGYDLCVD